MTAEQTAHATNLAALKVKLIPESTINSYNREHIENMKKYENIFVYGRYNCVCDDEDMYYIDCN